MRKKTLKYGYFCQNCRKELELDDQVFFVEENSGNYFCCEECIQDFYGPVAQYYFQQHLSLRDPHDIPVSDFEEYENYATLCLEKPKEIWLDEGDANEQYYYFISDFSDAGGTFTYIIMSFCLESEPTFVLLAFPTRDKQLVNSYRKGKKLDKRLENLEARPPVEQSIDGGLVQPALDERGMALMEEMLRNRNKNDIKPKDFEEHSYLLDETIENPDEAWEIDSENDHDTLLTLITHHDDSLHYIVICAMDKADNAQQTWRVLYHFPTGDPGLVERYRRGLPRDGVATYDVVH